MTKSIVIGIVLSLISCGKSTFVPPNLDNLEVFRQKVEEIKPGFAICKQHDTSFACKEQQDGDVVVWNGLLALSGDKTFCSALNFTVDETGRPWRGPTFYKNDKINEFSRDSTVGLAAWVVGCNDKATWQRFSTFYKKTDKLCEHPSDGKCDKSSNSNDLVAHIDRHFSISNSENTRGYSELLLAQARFSEEGYPMHLTGCQIFILNKTGTSNATLDLAKTKLRERDPSNPFYNYLDKDSNAAVNLALEQVGLSGTNPQWSFERHGSEKAWENSMGWQFLFLSNLLQNN
jgi:hypothetical protein